MAFIPEKMEDKRNFETPEQFPTTASETYVLGEVLQLTNGKLHIAAVTSAGKQTFISCQDYVAPASGNLPLAVYRITPEMIFKAPCYATNAGTTIGDMVTLHTDGLQVTATTGSGCFKVIDLLGSGATYVLGRFATVAGS